MRVNAGPVACLSMGVVMCRLVSGVLLDERERRVDVVWSLDADARHPLESTTREAHECAGGRELDDAGDAGAGEGLHGEVPAHGGGDLGHEELEVAGAGVDPGSVVVGPDR